MSNINIITIMNTRAEFGGQMGVLIHESNDLARCRYDRMRNEMTLDHRGLSLPSLLPFS